MSLYGSWGVTGGLTQLTPLTPTLGEGLSSANVPSTHGRKQWALAARELGRQSTVGLPDDINRPKNSWVLDRRSVSATKHTIMKYVYRERCAFARALGSNPAMGGIGNYKTMIETLSVRYPPPYTLKTPPSASWVVVIQHTSTHYGR